MAKRAASIGRAELRVLDYVQQHGPATVRQVADHFAAAEGVGRTTVLNVLVRLWRKDHLTRRPGPAGGHLYAAREPRPRLLRRLVGEFARDVLGGQPRPVRRLPGRRRRRPDRRRPGPVGRAAGEAGPQGGRVIQAWLAGEWAAATRGGLALLLAWAAAVLPRVPAAVRCWAWRAAFGVVLVSFVWVTPVDVAVRRAAVVPEQSRGVSPRTSPAPRRATDDAGSARPGPTRPGSVDTRTTGPVWPTVAFSLWAAFAAAYAVRLATAAVAARRLRRGRPTAAAELADLCRTLSVRPPAVVSNPAARSPLLVGTWRPTVVLPDPPPADLRPILAHELAHLRRHDLLWNWLPVVATALLPWHPLVWVARRRWRLATESAADAEALAATGGDVAGYGRLIVSVATGDPPPGVLAVAAGAGSGWVLKRRLAAMAHITIWSRGPRTAVGIIVGVFGTAAAVPWRAVADPVPTTTTPPRTTTHAVAFVTYTADWMRFEADLTRTLAAIQTADDAAAAGPALRRFEHRRADLRERLQVLGDMDHAAAEAVGTRYGRQSTAALGALVTQLVRIRDRAPLRAALAAELVRLDLTTPPVSLPDRDDAKPAAATQPTSLANPLPFVVPFERGTSEFEPGDRITVFAVRGTSPGMAGGVYQIVGTYTLASHDTATLAGSVTARDAVDGKGPWNPAQQVTVGRGSGTFTLLLPVNTRGWPHVSFYGSGGSFGGIYIGTGDSVLRR